MSEALRNFLWILPLVFAANLQEWGFTQILQVRTQSPKEGDPLASRGRAVCGAFRDRGPPHGPSAGPHVPASAVVPPVLRHSYVDVCRAQRGTPWGSPGGGGLDAASICGWDSKCA